MSALSLLFDSSSPAALLLQLIHLATLPAGAALICLLVFMAGKRKQAQLMTAALSAAVSLNGILKGIFKIPRTWLTKVQNAPYLAEGGYAFPCLHVQLTAAVFSLLMFTSKRRSVKICCGAWILITALTRLLTGLQSAADIAAGLALGICCAFLLSRYGNRKWITAGILLLFGLISGLRFGDPWGLGLLLTFLCTALAEKGFERAEKGRTRFGRLYGTLLAAGTFLALFVFVPFLIEWLITPRLPGQILIVFTVTFLPRLYRLFPCF